MKRRARRSVSPSTVLLVRQIIVGLLIAAFFGMLLTSVWYVTRIDSFTISTVTVSGGETISHSQVEEIVQNKLSGAYLKFIPYRFALLYPHEDIELGIREIKRIKNLTVMRQGGTELAVEFEEYIPHALWCKDSESEGCFFLDDNGYSFSPAPSLSGGSFLRFIAIVKDPTEHTQAFSPEDYQKVHELVVLLREKGWYVSKAEVDGAGDAFFTIVDGGEFKVSLRQSSEDTIDNMSTVLNSEKFAHIKPGNFEYVDLRFGSKVFVNEVTITTTTPTPTSTPSLPQYQPVAEEIPAAPVFAETEGSTTIMMIKTPAEAE